MLRGDWTDEIDDENGEKRGERGVDRPDKSLADGCADNFVKRLGVLADGIILQVLPRPVKDDDRVVDRETEDDENSGDKKRIDLISRQEMSEDDKHTGRNDHVMAERENGNKTVFPR